MELGELGQYNSSLHERARRLPPLTTLDRPRDRKHDLQRSLKQIHRSAHRDRLPTGALARCKTKVLSGGQGNDRTMRDPILCQ